MKDLFMQKNKVLLSIFSNWSNLFISVVVAFIVSPIIVNQLGNETYGIWVLIVSLTSYFTILDFGINGAIVRFISKYKALNDSDSANKIFSTSFAFFFVIAIVVVLFCAVFAFYFKDMFEITQFENSYLYLVFLVVGIDLAFNLIFSVFLGSLKAVGRFLEVNVIAVTLNIVKNIIIVILLTNDYSLLTIAVLQLVVNAVKFTLQYVTIRKFASYLYFSVEDITKESFKQLYNYSLYGFIIAIAMKIVFYTDSVVIGAVLDVSQVTFYAIPTMLMQYLEQFIWAIIAVLLPIISAQDAVGKNENNARMYNVGTKYAMLLCAPIFLVLYFSGSSFIGLWMGEQYKIPSGNVLKILLIGYFFFLAQLIAHGILKGLSKHKILAILLSIEAVANLGLSLHLAPMLGINGVALGTTIPLLIINVIAVPYFTCKELGTHWGNYLIKYCLYPVLSVVLFYFGLNQLNYEVAGYFDLAVFSLAVFIVFFVYSLFVHFETEHKAMFLSPLKKLWKN
jgi:O-antigen/teichoic acid export membrane protein